MARPKKKENVEENKSVLLSEIINKINIEIPASADLDDDKVFNKLFGDVSFNIYVPIHLKKGYIGLYMSRSNFVMFDLDEPYTLVTELEKLSVLHLLIKPYTNIEVDIEELSDDDYDALLTSGFVDKIISICGNDYNKLLGLLNETYRVEKMINDNELMKSFDTEQMMDVIEKMKNLFENLSEEQLSKIEGIVSANDPTFLSFKRYFTEPQE